MKQLALGIIISIFLLGCSGKDGAPGPAGKDGGLLIGSLTGSVNLYDEFGNSVSGVNGTTIEIEGSDPLISYAPTTQNFTITGVKTGTYRLKFINTGYETSYSNIFQFVGGNFMYTDASLNQVLSQKPKAKITNFTLASLDSSGIYYNLTITGKIDQTVTSTTPRNMVLYIGDINNVSYSNYKNYLTRSLLQGDGSFSFNIQLIKTDYLQFQNIYMIGYLKGLMQSNYIDYDLNTLILAPLSDPSSPLFIR